MSFTLLDFVILLIIAGICGALGQVISGTGRGGLLGKLPVIVTVYMALPSPKSVTTLQPGHAMPAPVDTAILLPIAAAVRFREMVRRCAREHS